MKEVKIVEIKSSVGGPCMYRQGVLEDGTLTGHIQFTGQTKEKLEQELLASVETGRDDVKSFVDSILA